MPPLIAEQQPPLHGLFMSHAVPQVCVVRLHAWLTGQSLALVQPQALAPLPAMHDLPALLAAQLAHSALPVAHAADVLPATHVEPSQQPPWHACVALHDVEQTPLDVLHDCPVGQSAALLQPVLMPPMSPPPRSSPPPAERSSPPPPPMLTVMASQPAARARASLDAEPSVAPPPSAVTVTLMPWPAGYVEKSSSTVPWVMPPAGSATVRGASLAPSMLTAMAS